MPIQDVKRAFAALTIKADVYSALFAYYDGEAPLRYVSDRVREVFQFKDARFALNWAAVVIDAENDRINLKQFTVGKQTATTDALNELFRQTGLDLDADEVHRASLICGESFVFAWKDANDQVEGYYNDPRLCHVFYDDENPRLISFAAKWWIGGDDKRYLNLYYSDAIEYYVSSGKAENVTTADSFQPADVPTAANPFGVIPIFHFRPERRRIKSRLANVIDPQDAVNKLFSDMMVAAEFGAFNQRVFITQADVSTLKSAPDENIVIPSNDGDGETTQAIQFPATPLENFLIAMGRIESSIAVITGTPKHYLQGQGGDPSGEALIAMEAPLNRKVQSVIQQFKPVWADVAAFMLRLSGQTVDAADIEPLFERAETVQPRTNAEIRELNKRAGMPLKTTLRREGWTDQELDALDAEPPDPATLVTVAESVAPHVDNRTYLEIVAPAFNWDAAKIDTIEAARALDADQTARNEARGFAEAIFPPDGNDGQT